MVQKVDAKELPKHREERILRFWEENDVFKQSDELRKGAKEFVFYDGPPTANGKPHPGHVLTRVIKDVYPRYKVMKGYHVERKAGWDTHGLPVEIEIEKKHNISGKKQIQAFGVERFIKECRDSVLTYEANWRTVTERLGFWVDMDNPYMTLTDDYIESVWHLLKTIFDQGHLLQGHRVSPYCPHCETTLSSHEVAQGYQDVKDLTVTAKFRLNGPDEDGHTFLLAWTTTPWTLPSNVALAVNPNFTYVLIHREETNENYWVADGLKEKLMEQGDRVVQTKKGSELQGLSYEPVFPYVSGGGKKHIVVTSNHVTDESGTGIVHMAPAFGEEDYRVCKEHGIVFVHFVDLSGHFTEDVTDFSGRFVRDEDTNVDIVKYLAAHGSLFEKHKHEHPYPHCWRCDTPLLYYAIDSWFIQTTAIKERMIENSQSVNWMPDHIKSGRFGNFLENIVDWNISRSRYWGTPLPVWVCDSCDQRHCVGSKAELRELSGELPPELHKPYIDDIHWSCDCGGTMRRVADVIDCWFDSGSMPFAQWHYPFENTATFQRLYPADFISEAIDQTRGWFYSLLAISTFVTGQAPYKNVLVLGHVLDEDGKKMSKSKGNVIDSLEALDLHGADAMRFYFLSNTQPWNSVRFFHKAVAECKGKFVDLIQNVHALYALYAGIDDFNPREHVIDVAKRPVMDRWITAHLHQTIAHVDAALDRYDATAASRELQDFVTDLSTWYIRRNRERFWASGMDDDKAAAFLTLYEVLAALSKLIAPFTPFIAEQLYQNVVRGTDVDAPISVHLCDFPAADFALIDEALLAEMGTVVRVVETARHLRNESKIKTRQPLSTLYLPTESAPVLDAYKEIIQGELNVKEIAFVALEDIATPELYLNLKEVGKTFGKLLPQLNKAAKEAAPALVRQFQEVGELQLEGQTLTKEHAQVRYYPSFQGLVDASGKGFVGLCTELTDALIEEGYVREMISKMQMMRKEVNYNVTDRVSFCAVGDAELLEVLQRNQDQIKATVLIDRLVFESGNGDLLKEWDVNGKPLTLTVSKAK